MTEKSYTVDSLFAGIGGICQAFNNAGCRVIWANEFDKKACETYCYNLQDITLVESDIKKIKTEEIPEADIITAGFPCQPFSLAGNRRGLNDPRGRLFSEITRIATEMKKKPRVLFLENVSNLLTHDNGETYDFVKKTLNGAGYEFVVENIMNAKDYSDIPQSRPRIYIIAFRKEEDSLNFEFPKKKGLHRSINSIIDRSVQQELKYYYNSDNAKYYDDFVKEITDRNSIYQFRRVYIRKNKSNLCPALTASMGMGGHNVPIIIDDYGIRKLTPYECLAFQGFPSNFEFPEMADNHKYKQIGNSVSIPVVESIAKNIISALKTSDYS
jgi:DNA (cytosine-5)-methyltransferase 1